MSGCMRTSNTVGNTCDRCGKGTMRATRGKAGTIECDKCGHQHPALRSL